VNGQSAGESADRPPAKQPAVNRRQGWLVAGSGGWAMVGHFNPHSVASFK
jgi:hypothetical protein